MTSLLKALKKISESQTLQQPRDGVRIDDGLRPEPIDVVMEPADPAPAESAVDSVPEDASANGPQVDLGPEAIIDDESYVVDVVAPAGEEDAATDRDASIVNDVADNEMNVTAEAATAESPRSEAPSPEAPSSEAPSSETRLPETPLPETPLSEIQPSEVDGPPSLTEQGVDVHPIEQQDAASLVDEQRSRQDVDTMPSVRDATMVVSDITDLQVLLDASSSESDSAEEVVQVDDHEVDDAGQIEAADHQLPTESPHGQLELDTEDPHIAAGESSQEDPSSEFEPQGSARDGFERDALHELLASAGHFPVTDDPVTDAPVADDPVANLSVTDLPAAEVAEVTDRDDAPTPETPAMSTGEFEHQRRVPDMTMAVEDLDIGDVPRLYLNTPDEEQPLSDAVEEEHKGFAEQLLQITPDGEVHPPATVPVVDSQDNDDDAPLGDFIVPGSKAQQAADEGLEVDPQIAAIAAIAGGEMAADEVATIKESLQPLQEEGLEEVPVHNVAAPVVPRKTSADPRQPTEFEEEVRTAVFDPLVGNQVANLCEKIVTSCPTEDHATCVLLAVQTEHHVAELMACIGMIHATGNQKNVLLVDGNPSYPLLTKGFQLQGQVGFTDACAGKRHWKSVVQPTTSPRLSVVPAGEQNDEIMDRSPIITILSEMSEEYDLVLVDGGKADSVFGVPLCTACQRTYLVVRLGKTPRDIASATLEFLRGKGAEVHGSLATNVPAKEVS